MILFQSNLIKDIFSRIDTDNFTIIEEIDWKKINSHTYKKDILNLAKNLNSKINLWDNVAILIKSNILFSEIFIACMLRWAHVTLLDPGMGLEIMKEKIKCSNIQHLFIEWLLYDYYFFNTFEIFNANIHFYIHGFSLTGFKNENIRNYLKENESEFAYHDIDENKEAITTYTWWTTWNPKWVVHSHFTIGKMLENIRLLITDTRIYYADMPHFLLLWIIAWAKVISWPYNLSSEKLEKVFRTYGIDTYFSPPYKYNYFIEKNKKLPISLKNILLWSAPIYVWFLEKLLPLADVSQKITCIYGMTEMLPIAYIDWREKVTLPVEWDVLGKIIHGVEYTIDTDSELLLCGSHMMLRYQWMKKIKHIESWDLVKIENDTLIMIGRKKDMIIRKEYNIYPWLYEPVISKIPWVKECAIFGIYDTWINDERIILCIERYNSKFPCAINEVYIENCLKHWKYSIDTFAFPDEIIFKDLPRSGKQKKIDKQLLKKWYRETKNRLQLNK